MNPSRRIAFAALVVLAAALPARAATDPAALFPADTLVYAEVHKPAEVGPHVAALVKGTVLAEGLPFIHDRKDRAKSMRDLNGKPELGLLSLVASPELLAEFGKLGGLAAGVVGYTEQGIPEVALAVLTGDSPAGAAARAYLTLTPNLRRVGTVGSVPVFQSKPVSISYDNQGRQQVQNDKPPTDTPGELTYAYTPALFVVGSTKAAVAVVLARFSGAAKSEGTLADAPAFRSAAAAHRRPGVFFYVNPAEADKKLAARARQTNQADVPDAWGWFDLVVNGKAVRTVAGSVVFRDGGLAATVTATFDPAQKSPLVEFLSGSGAKVELLHHAPKPAVFAVTVVLPPQGRAAALVGFLDALTKAEGEIGRLPGEAVKELEEKLKVPLSDGLIGKTRAVTVVMPAKQELPKGARPLPLLVFHCETPEVAAAWEAFVPKLVADLSGAAAPPEPASELIAGTKVLSLTGTGLPWKSAVSYARKESVFVVGLDRKLVGAAVAGDPGGSVVGASGVAEPAEGTGLFGTLAPGEVIRLLAERPKAEGPVVPVPGPQPRRNDDGQFELEKSHEDEAKAMAEFLTAFAGLPPMTVAVRRAGADLQLDLWQPKVEGGAMTPVVNSGVAWFDKLLNRYSDPNGNSRFGRFR